MSSLTVSEAKPGDLPERYKQLLNAREKVFRPPWEFFFPKKKIPSLSLPFRGR
jgi:hypothetical protein